MYSHELQNKSEMTGFEEVSWTMGLHWTTTNSRLVELIWDYPMIQGGSVELNYPQSF